MMVSFTQLTLFTSLVFSLGAAAYRPDHEVTVTVTKTITKNHYKPPVTIFATVTVVESCMVSSEMVPTSSPPEPSTIISDIVFSPTEPNTIVSETVFTSGSPEPSNTISRTILTSGQPEPSITISGTVVTSDSPEPSTSASPASASESSTPTNAPCVAGAELFVNGGFDSGSLAPWSQTVSRQQSYYMGVTSDPDLCLTGSCLVNELYDGTVNMIEQTITYCSTSSITAYDFTATAKVAQGASQCYLLACINGPRQCGSPIIIGEDYTEAVVHFNNLEDSDSAKLQVYTECIGDSDDYLEVILDNLSLVSV